MAAPGTRNAPGSPDAEPTAGFSIRAGRKPCLRRRERECLDKAAEISGLCCLLVLLCGLALPAQAGTHLMPAPSCDASSFGHRHGLVAVPAAAATGFVAQDHGATPRPSCYGGRETRDFGWTLIGYGIATLRYVVGLFLILIGGLFVALGSALSLLDWLLCWR